MKHVHLNILAGILLLATAANAVDSKSNTSETSGRSKPKQNTVQNSAQKSKKEESKIVWQGWSDDLFARAKSQNRYVLLDLEAVWCHWCHVMAEKTYTNPQIVKLINDRFIAVRVDQDSRPDLSNRYDDYGWPATVVFDPGGKERAIWSGFIPANEMVPMLRSALQGKIAVKSPQKTLSTTNETALTSNLRAELEKRYKDGYDTENGGWGFSHKFLDWDTVEYAMSKARSGDALSEKRAKATLALQEKLIDPVWGGVYQYSTDNDWVHPHFEKIMQMQAENLKIYSQAYGQWHDESYLKSAKEIEKFLADFLTSPQGAFYTSQDADLVQGKHSADYFALDDAQRRKQGIPRIDKHIYARENGWAINALCWLFMVSGDDKYLDKAERAADWIIANRSISGGGFRHDETDSAGPYLGDTLAMGRAFLSLYTVTADRKWLDHAREAANFINGHFHEGDQKAGSAGFATADLTGHNPFKPSPLLEENVALARFANLLFQYTGDKTYHSMSENAMRYLATPDVAKKRSVYVAGILSADDELKGDPVHVTVVGSKKDPGARSLFRAGLTYPAFYKRIEWWDPAEGPLEYMDVEYPQLKQAAAFTCVNGRCSAPIYAPDLVVAKLEQREAK